MLSPEFHKELGALRSQIATLKSGRGAHRKYAPYAFTEHDRQFVVVFDAIRQRVTPPEKQGRKIGFGQDG